jgi:cytochrome c-type biogenesis protein CcmH
VIEFILGAAGLLLLAMVFLLLPGLFQRSARSNSERQSNLDWLSNRQSELDGEVQAGVLLQEARLRMLEDGVDQLVEKPVTGMAWKPWWLLLPFAALATVVYIQLGAATDVVITHGLQGLGEESSEQDYRALLLQVEQRARQRPENLHYQAMLGRFYMDEGDYQRASELYLSLAEAAPQDAAARALAAQAGYLAANRVLDTDSQVLAEQALAIDPHQPTALGLLGMVAFENQQYRAAIDYWRRLLVREPPESPTAQMISGVIARAEAALGGKSDSDSAAPFSDSATPLPAGHPAVASSAAAPSQVQQPATIGVAVRVQLPAGVSVDPGATVFVFARDPDSGSRMPVAVKRLRGSDLPISLYLDDAASMAGQKISALSQVVVIARVSPAGQPGEEFASHQGQLGPLVPSAGAEELQLELQPKIN